MKNSPLSLFIYKSVSPDQLIHLFAVRAGILFGRAFSRRFPEADRSGHRPADCARQFHHGLYPSPGAAQVCRGRIKPLSVPRMLYNIPMSENKTYKPELLSRQAEITAWALSVAAALGLYLLSLRAIPPFWAWFLFAILVFSAASMSLGNWMDRKTFIRLEDGRRGL